MTTRLIDIRTADPHECEALTAIGIRAKSVWQYSESQMETFRQELTLTPQHVARHQVNVITVSCRIAGYSLLRELDRETVELDHLFIDPPYMHCGYGTRLFQHAVASSRTAAYRRMAIQSDPNAAGFYQKQGVPLVKKIPSSIPGRWIPYFELRL